MAAEIQGGSNIIKPLKWYKKLRTGKGRKETGMFLVEGPRAVNQVLKCHPERIHEILIDEKAVIRRAKKVPVREITSRQLASLVSSRTSQGILAVVTLPPQSDSTELPEDCGTKILLLESVQDPGNVGTLIRTAAAFNFSGVILSDTCADPFAPKAVRASAGSLLAVWIRRTINYLSLAASLKRKGFTVVAADTHGKEAVDRLSEKRLVFLLGSEGKGLSPAARELADRVVTIPYNAEEVESLNVAAAGAIGMFVVTGS